MGGHQSQTFILPRDLRDHGPYYRYTGQQGAWITRRRRVARKTQGPTWGQPSSSIGNLQMTLRDRFAGPHTPETARRRAWTAVSFRNDTLALSEVAAPDAEAYGANFITEALMLGGGVPVEAAGSIIGAVGVSGATGGEMDDDCARAGIEAVAADLAF